jgi:hypothetical protein
MMSIEDKRDIDVINRKACRELKYEMDPFDGKLVKLPNGKTKAVIV